MTMNQTTKTTLTENWGQAKARVQERFGTTGNGNPNDADELVSSIAEQSGRSKTEVERDLKEIAEAYKA